jgi:hypothetical protein
MSSVVSSIRTQEEISAWQKWGHFYLGLAMEARCSMKERGLVLPTAPPANRSAL